MARLSKTHQFAIHEDIPTPDPKSLEPLDDAVAALEEAKAIFEEVKDDAKRIAHDDENADNSGELGKTEDAANDHERRISALSLSSLPQSAYEEEADVAEGVVEADITPVIRPSLRQIEAMQRMQMMSAPHLGKRSPRRSIARSSRPKSSRPKYVASHHTTGSPRPRRRISELTEAPDEEREHYPLVLLHAALLPVDLPWREEAMQAILSTETLESLRLLRSKVSETVLSRGILIQHPKHDFELLEERLLEALELKHERITKCGHFHGRESMSSQSDSDSGVGFSDDGSEGNLCNTCQCHIKDAGVAAGHGSKKWTVRVFAANGLLRASAWAAAWPDMESIDVEIMPWISEDSRRKLDDALERERAESIAEQPESDEERIRQIVEEHVQSALNELKSQKNNERAHLQAVEIQDFASDDSKPANIPIHTPSKSLTPPPPVLRDIPDIYRPAQIPLAVLLKNTIYVLAEDRKTVASFFMMLVVIFLCISIALRGIRTDLSLSDSRLRFEPLPSSPSMNSPQIVVAERAQLDKPYVEPMLEATNLSTFEAFVTADTIPDATHVDAFDERCSVERTPFDLTSIFVHETCAAEIR